MAAPGFNDINSPLFIRQNKDDAASKKFITGVEDSSECAKEETAPEYRIMSLKMIIPPEGIKQNSTFDFEGEFEKVGETSSKRIVVDVKTTYKDNKEYDDIIAPNIEATFDNNKFKGTCKKFWFNDFFLKDSEKSTDATFNLQLIAKGKTVVNEFVSEIYTFPMATKIVILKLGHYDDNGVKNYPDRCKKGDTNYIEGDAVLKLQQNLIRFRLLVKGAADGDFGEKTHNAVLAFQDYAKKFERIKMKEGLVLKADRITFTGDIDGIVGDKTQKEIDLWYQQEYVRPVPTLYHKDYDENWVKNGKGKKGTEEFHQSTPVTDLQKNLKKVGVFQNGKDDGHFFDRTKAELIRFQEAAAKGEFAQADNTRVVLDNKLVDFQKGTACPNTIDFLNMLVGKGLKTIKGDSNIFPLKTGDCTNFKRNFGVKRSGGRIHAGCDLIAHVGAHIIAVADGEIKYYSNFYWQTYELVIDHNDFMVRYGEVQPPHDNQYGKSGPPKDVCNGLPDNLKPGMKVQKGQHIAYVGQLRKKVGENFINHEETMLHFELYKGTGKGEYLHLTDEHNKIYSFVAPRNYMRRLDLLNPTDFLEKIFE